MFATLIMGLIAGPAVSLYGSPTVSPVTAAAWASDPFPPYAPSSISFLALSHAPPPDVIEIAMNNPTTITPMSSPPSASVLMTPTTNVNTIGISDGRIISRWAARVTRLTAVAVLGLLGALHDPGLLLELASHLLDDGAAGAADSLHRKRHEQVHHQSADQQTDEHRAGCRSRSSCDLALVGQLALERVEQHERRERRGADRVSLGDGLRRVADRVERVGDVADLLGEVGHLGDAAGVVGDRAECVERDDQAGQRQLRHHRHADPVDALAVTAGRASRRRRCRARSRSPAARSTGSPGRGPG